VGCKVDLIDAAAGHVSIIDLKLDDNVIIVTGDFKAL
jgi:hypothetical protein